MKFTDDMEVKTIAGSNYGFSAQKIDSLTGASEYTLVTIVVDVSGSVTGFGQDIEEAVKTVVRACQKDKRVDNLMLRVVYFNTKVDEIHGFQLLSNCNDNLYNGTINPGGGTSLFDATYNSVKAMTDFGRDLTEQDYAVNSAVFVITDGDDNCSSVSVKMVADAITEAKTDEAVESIMPVLIGVNTDAASGLNRYLEDYRDNGGFQQYIAIADATANSLAKLANFISKSISSQSQALGTGGPSQSITF